MEQRRLRLGDILDDYCPRERRLTNHVVVAMIEEDVKQARCTTCDAEHAYKGGKVPRRRKKETPTALYKEVLAGMPETKAAPVLSAAIHIPAEAAPEAADAVALALDAAAPIMVISAPAIPTTLTDSIAAAAADVLEAIDVERAPAAENVARQPEVEARQPDVEARQPDVEEGPVHRQLIRAQLPRIEGHKEERRLPEFTIRQAGRGGNGHFRGGDARMKQPRAGGHAGSGGNGNGGTNRPHGGPRFAGPRPGAPGRSQPGRGGPAGGFRAGQPRPGGGRKRSR